MQPSEKVGIAVGAIVITAACVGGVILSRRFGDPLPAKLAEAKALGLPLTIADLHIKPVPDSDNAAVLFYRAFDMVHRSPSGYADIKAIRFGGDLDDPDLQLADIAIRHLKKELDLVKAATGKSHFYVSRATSNRTSERFPDLVFLNACVRAFCMTAGQLGKDGHGEAALSEFRTARRVCLLCPEHPLLIEALARGNRESLIRRFLDPLISTNRRNFRFLQQAKVFNDSFGALPDIRQAFLRELPYTLAQINAANTLKAAGHAGSSDERLLTTPLSSDDKDQVNALVLASYIEFLRELPNKPDDWDRLRRAAMWLTSFSKLGVANLSKPAAALLRFVAYTNSSGLVDAVERVQEHRRLTGTAILLCLEGLKKGRYPEQLPDYGESSIDPFSGQTFMYERVGNGFTLKSVGSALTRSGHSDELDVF